MNYILKVKLGNVYVNCISNDEVYNLFEIIGKNPLIKKIIIIVSDDVISGKPFTDENAEPLTIHVNVANYENIFRNVKFPESVEITLILKTIKLNDINIENLFGNVKKLSLGDFKSCHLSDLLVDCIINSKTLECVNFKCTCVDKIMEKFLKNNKSVKTLMFTYLTGGEMIVIFNYLRENFTITNIIIGGNELDDNRNLITNFRTDDNNFTTDNCYLIHIYLICIRNRNIIIKLYMLMMRRRFDSIVSLLPRRLLIYLLEFLHK